MTITILSESKDKKFIKIDNETIKVTGDIFEFIKKTLKVRNLKLTDFNNFIADNSESFTGLREAVVITNTLNYLINNQKIEDLNYPKYHKEPNININLSK